MPKTNQREINSEEFPIEQELATNTRARDPHRGGIVVIDKDLKQYLEENPDYVRELKFNEEPVVIRLEPQGGPNPPVFQEVWNNGTPCEVMVDAQNRIVQNIEDGHHWRQLPKGAIPIDEVLVIKRKFFEQIVRSKITDVKTVWGNPGTPLAGVNDERKTTKTAIPFSLIHDPNPNGVAWLRELRRRPF